MTNEEIAKAGRIRAKQMLKDDKINLIYQSFKTEEEANNWIIKTALATLILPLNERKKSL
jgi:hypothetical protein